MDTNNIRKDEDEEASEFFACMPLSNRLSSLSDPTIFNAIYVKEATHTMNDLSSLCNEHDTDTVDTTEPPSTSAYVNEELSNDELNDTSEKSLPPPPSEEFLKLMNQRIVLSETQLDNNLISDGSTKVKNEKYFSDNTRCVPPHTPHTTPCDSPSISRLPSPSPSSLNQVSNDRINITTPPQSCILQPNNMDSKYYMLSDNISNDISTSQTFSQKIKSRFSLTHQDLNTGIDTTDQDIQSKFTGDKLNTLDSNSSISMKYENDSNFSIRSNIDNTMATSFSSFEENTSEEYNEVNYNEDTLSNCWFNRKSIESAGGPGIGANDPSPMMFSPSTEQLSILSSSNEYDSSSGSDLSESFVRNILGYGDEHASFENIAYQSDEFQNEGVSTYSDSDITSQRSLFVKNEEFEEEIFLGDHKLYSSNSDSKDFDYKLDNVINVKSSHTPDSSINTILDTSRDGITYNIPNYQADILHTHPSVKYESETIAADKRYYRLVKSDDDTQYC